MAAATGIWNRHPATAQLAMNQLPGAKAQALPTAASPAATAADSSSSSSSSSSSTDSAVITANDFLSLLVTEMQNQDPTADTDPNEYINQLVQVNSLEQLISINQNLQTALGISNTSSDAAAATSTPATGKAATAEAQALSAAQSATQGAGTSAMQPGGRAHAGAPEAPGNIGIPQATPAALAVAQALSGQSHSTTFPGGLAAPR